MCAICGCAGQVHGDEHVHHGEHEHHHHHGHEHGHVHEHGHGHEHGHDHVHHGEHEHHHHHGHEHGHGHDHGRGQQHGLLHGHGRSHEHALEAALLAKNGRIAEQNRRMLEAQRVAAFNLVSSPGAGKTTLLERTISDLRHERRIQVIEGDQATSHDADRIRRAGATAIQVNTGTGCHLDAAMVEASVRQLAVEPGALLFIENVGNLVCPALFDLGERAKVLIASVTEGEDKPLKYPHMFRASQLVLLNKIDLLPYLRFDVDLFVRNAMQVNARLEVLTISAATGHGLDAWYSWVRSRHAGT